MACLAGLLAACSEQLPPRSVEHFMRESAALQATLLRCRDAGFEAEDDVECANARLAAERLGEQKAEAERAEREAAFERKREALRRREAESQRAAGWPEEEEIEPPLGEDYDEPGGPVIGEFPPDTEPEFEEPEAPVIGEFPPDAEGEPDSETSLSEDALEAEIRRLQEELERRHNESPPEVEAGDRAVTETAPTPE